jgi:hypothetical protein
MLLLDSTPELDLTTATPSAQPNPYNSSAYRLTREDDDVCVGVCADVCADVCALPELLLKVKGFVCVEECPCGVWLPSLVVCVWIGCGRMDVVGTTDTFDLYAHTNVNTQIRKVLEINTYTHGYISPVQLLQTTPQTKRTFQMYNNNETTNEYAMTPILIALKSGARFVSQSRLLRGNNTRTS